MRRFAFQEQFELAPGLPVPKGPDGFNSRQPPELVLLLEGIAMICPRCKEQERHITRSGKMTGYCLPCGSSVMLEWQRNNREKTRAYCREWAKTNPRKAVYNPEKAKEYRAKQDAALRVGYQKTYYESHLEQVKAKQKKYFWENREKRLADARSWREKNKDRRNRERNEWKKANPEKVKAAYHRRRVAKKGCKVIDKTITLKALCIRDNWVCKICFSRIAEGASDPLFGPSIDHIIPISKGGNHVWSNIQLAHRSCNSRKCARGLSQKELPL